MHTSTDAGAQELCGESQGQQRMQAEDGNGRLHAIGRVDSKGGANIIVVQFYLSAESQSGHPDGLQRCVPDSRPGAKPVQGTGCSVLAIGIYLNT